MIYQEKPTASPPAAPASSPAAGEEASRRVTVIEPKTGWAGLDFAEIWAYRDLLYTFAVRDVKLRYRQTALGAIWVVAQPLLASLIFTVVFGILGKGKFSSYGLPYFVFAFAGNLIWNAFNSTVTKANMSLVQNANLVSKIYFPRLVLPLSIVLSTLVDFSLSFGVMVLLMIGFHIAPSFAILLTPLFLLFALTLAVGVGLFTAALTVQYRDVQYIVPIVMQFLFFASPVNFALPTDVPNAVRIFYGINPLTPLIEGMRWCILGTPPPTIWRGCLPCCFCGFSACRRRILVPQNGAEVCRCHLKTGR